MTLKKVSAYLDRLPAWAALVALALLAVLVLLPAMFDSTFTAAERIELVREPILLVFVAMAAWVAGRYGWLTPRTPADRLPRARWGGVITIALPFVMLLNSANGWKDPVYLALASFFVVLGPIELLKTRARAT